MNIINSLVCRNKKNLTFVKNAFISNTLKTNYIHPLNVGIPTVDGYRAEGVPDTIQVNFKFDENSFTTGNSYIYTADRDVLVISVKEVHTTPSTVASSVSLIKRSGIVDSTVVSSLDLSGSGGTVQSGTVNGANASLSAGDSLRLDELISVAGLQGAVLGIILKIV